MAMQRLAVHWAFLSGVALIADKAFVDLAQS
jgi:hypothetical protein